MRSRGEATSVFKESDPHWINLEGDIEFLKDGKRFLWTSQRDGGFRHIFLSSIDGKSVKQLTKGNWEVTAINAVDESESGGRVYYTSTEPTPTGTPPIHHEAGWLRQAPADRRQLSRTTFR